MRCHQCGDESPGTPKVCPACGAAQIRRCGHECAADAKFCSECGTPLAEGARAPEHCATQMPGFQVMQVQAQ
ncbi:MAG: zinc-ribbon domain-containing protein [Oceanospirillaceae bacterium]|nr:zinc-ribbon domain-containing protein [Oceanospirillaceae bacterium]